PTGLETTDTPSGCSSSGLNVVTPVCRICNITGNSGYVQSRKLTIGSLVSTTNYTRTTYVPSGYPSQALGQGQLTRVVDVTEPIDGSTSRLIRSIFHVPDAASDPSTGGLELERTISPGTA